MATGFDTPIPRSGGEPSLSVNDVPMVCLPDDRLHPASGTFLQQYLDGRMSEELFRIYFSLPNSDYIALSGCIVDWMRGMGL